MGEKQGFVIDKAAITGGAYLQKIINNELIHRRVEIDAIAHI